MKFTDVQKNIIKKIADKTIYDSFSYLMTCGREYFHCYTPRKKEIEDISNISIEQLSKNYFKIINSKSVKTLLNEFLSLLDILEENKLIIRLLDQDLKHFVSYTIDSKIDIAERFKNSTSLTDSLVEYNIDQSLKNNYFQDNYVAFFPTLRKIRIEPTILLQDFISKDNFQTKVEVHNRKTSRISVIALVVAIFTSLFSILLPIFTNNHNNKILNKQSIENQTTTSRQVREVIDSINQLNIAEQKRELENLEYIIEKFDEIIFLLNAETEN